MKNFEKQFEAGKCKLVVNCGNMYCEDCKIIAEYWYRQALEFAQSQLAYDRAPCEEIEQELSEERKPE